MACVGLIGTGRMSQAVALGCLYEKIPVMLGSRSKDKAEKIREELLTKCENCDDIIRAGTQRDVVENCNLILLIVPFFPQEDGSTIDGVVEFIDNNRDILTGKQKVLCDLTNSYYRLPEGVENPFQNMPIVQGDNNSGIHSALEYHAGYLNDPDTYWTSGFKVIYSQSIVNKNYQAIEICGDAKGVEVLSEFITRMKFSPLNRGDRAAAPLLEPNGPKRVKP